MDELAQWCLEFIVKYPRLAKQVNDQYVHCQDEIEAGESVQNEIDLCKETITQLLEP